MMMNITDGIKTTRVWVLEHLVKNPVVEEYLEANFSPEEKTRVREFMNFLSDKYPAVRPILWPDRTIEEFEEKEVCL